MLYPKKKKKKKDSKIQELWESDQKQKRVLINVKTRNLLRYKNSIKSLIDRVKNKSQNIEQKAQDTGHIQV